MDRWWPPIFLTGLGLLALGWWRYQDLYIRLTQPWQWMTLAAVGALCVLASLLMWMLRKSAYVRAYDDHLRLVTPFLRMNISYRRILRTTTVSMGALFPTRRMPTLRRETIEPFLRRTALVVDLNAMPMPRGALRLFLSPFFFKDNTPHLVLLVQDWMSFSNELESMRVSGNTLTRAESKSQPSIFSRLPRK